jgi:TP901 family phage tail tape measure protein
MSANLGRAILEIGTEDTGFTKGLDKAEDKARSFLNALESISGSLSHLSRAASFEGIMSSMQAASSSSKALQQSLEKTLSTLQKLSSSKGPSIATPGIGPVDTSSITKAESASKSLASTLGELASKGVHALSGLASGAGVAASELVHLAGVAGGAVVSGIEAIGGAAGRAVGAVVNLAERGVEAGSRLATTFGKDSVSAFMGFEKEVSAAAAVSGLAGDELAKFKEEASNTALALGADNELSVSASKAASAITELTKAGFSADAALGGARGTAILASAANLEMDKSASIVANTISQFGLDISTTEAALKSTNHTVDILAKTANASAVDVSDLAETFKQAGPVAAAAGFSLEDVAKAAGVLGNAGIKASTAGTGLKMIIGQLASPSDKAAAAFEKLGYSVKNADGTIKPLQQQLVELRAKFATLSASEKIDLAKQIVGQDHFSKLLAIVGTGEDSFNAMSDAIDNATGAGAAMSKEMLNNLSGAVESMQGSVETLQIKIGKALSPALTLAARGVANLANALDPFADKLAGPVQKGVDMASRAISTVKDWPKAFGQAIDGITGKSKDLGLFSGVLNEVFGPGTGAKIAGVISKIGDNFGPVISKVIELYKAFSPLTNAFSILQGLLMGGVNGALDAFGESVYNISQELGYNTTEGVNAANTAIDALRSTIGAIIGVVTSFGQGLISGISGPLKEVISRFTEGGSTAKGFGKLLSDLPNLAGGLGKALGSLLGNLVNLGASLIEVGVQSGIVQTAFKLITSILTTAGTVVGTITSAIQSNMGLISGAVSAVGNTFQTAWGLVNNVITFATSLISSNMGTIATVITNVSNIISTGITVLGQVFDALKPAISALVTGIINAADVVTTKFNTALSDGKPLIDGVIGAIGFLADAFANVIGPAINIALAPVMMFFDAIAAGGKTVDAVMRGDVIGAMTAAGDGAMTMANTLATGLGPGFDGVTTAARNGATGTSDWGTSVNNATLAAQTINPTLATMASQHDTLAASVANAANEIDRLKNATNAASAEMSQTQSSMNTLDGMVKGMGPQVQDLWTQWQTYSEKASEGGASQDEWNTQAEAAKAQMSELNPKLGDIAAAYSNLQAKHTESKQAFEDNTISIGLNIGKQTDLQSELAKTSSAASSMSQDFSKGVTYVDEFGNSFSELSKTANSEINKLKSDVASIDMSSDASRIGTSIDTGIASGISANSGVISSAARAAAATALAAAKSELDIHSPSGEMEKGVGKPISQGIAAGILSAAKSVTSAMSEIGKAIGKAGLDEVAKQAETIAKIADSASKMATALTSVKTASGVGSDQIAKFAANVQTMVSAFTSSAAKFNDKMLKSASDYSDTSGKVADAGGKMANFFNQLVNFGGVNQAQIEMFNANVYQMVNAFVAAASKFKTEMLESASGYSDTAGKVADSSLKMLTLFEKLAKYGMVSEGQIEMFNANVYQLINAFSASAENFDTEMLDATAKYADTSGKVADGGLKAVTLLGELAKYSSIGVGHIEMFNADLMELVNAFVAASVNFDEKGLKGATTYADAAGKMVAVVGPGITALTALADYKSIASDLVDQFMRDLNNLVTDFVESAGWFDDEGLKGAAVYADSVGKMVAVIGPGVTGFASLKEYGHIANEQVSLFIHDLNNLVTDFAESAGWFDAEGLKAAGVFADSAGKIVGVLSNGVQGFAALSTYRSVPQTIIQAFVNDITMAVNLASVAASQMDGDMLVQVGKFGESVGKIFTGFKSAMDLFASLKDFKSTPSTTIQAFIDEVTLSVTLATAMAQKADTELVGQAVKFADSIGKIFNGLKSAMELFKSMENFKSIPSQQIQLLVDATTVAVTLMAKGGQAAEQFKMRADAFQQDMRAGFLAIRESASMALEAAKQAAASVAGMDAIPNPPDNGGGDKKSGGDSGGSKPPGMATGGKVASGGMFMVGEKGPELVQLPTGASVYNNQQTDSLVTAASNITELWQISAKHLALPG